MSLSTRHLHIGKVLLQEFISTMSCYMIMPLVIVGKGTNVGVLTLVKSDLELWTLKEL
jgi:hypothetical protein